MLLSGGRTPGHPISLPAAASFLTSGPMILSVYMLNSIGLVATVFSLAGAAVWSKPKVSHGA